MVELGFVTKKKKEIFAILLNKTMYGSLDVALRSFEKYSIIHITNLQSQTAYEFSSSTTRQANFISLHIDNSLVGGRKWQVEDFFKQLLIIFQVKVDRRQPNWRGLPESDNEKDGTRD